VTAIVVAVPVLVVVAWILAKRRRARLLSGTASDRPVFSVEPPRRRMSPLKGERL
jgi:hypothetical protein